MGGVHPPWPCLAGGIGGVQFFITKKKKGQIIDRNLSNTANT